ncbi:MAG: hypothetical protein HUJ87_15400 [Fusobacterium varium]|uniref:hypothetical protein n=1 Tax=Fusobacterium varium TaxID=856 RepID=UPI00242D3EBD|nr:hypothetical protein [Fusobacterium varium]MCF0171877.1 hypothetical protein [Fusobacterium varium]
MIYIRDTAYLLEILQRYSKKLEVEVENNKINYQLLMKNLEKINKKNSYSKVIRVLKKENSILNEDVVLNIKKSYLNSNNIRIIYLKK